MYSVIIPMYRNAEFIPLPLAGSYVWRNYQNTKGRKPAVVQQVESFDGEMRGAQPSMPSVISNAAGRS